MDLSEEADASAALIRLLDLRGDKNSLVVRIAECIARDVIEGRLLPGADLLSERPVRNFYPGTATAHRGPIHSYRRPVLVVQAESSVPRGGLFAEASDGGSIICRPAYLRLTALSAAGVAVSGN